MPVAHPYVYSAPSVDAAPEARLGAGPFVRWPEHHVYARDHGDRLGLGSYDHRPSPVDSTDLTDGARLGWTHAFEQAIASAQRLLRQPARFHAADKVNGVFAMTPDNLPFLGAYPGRPGLWVAQAIWVTHAAGAARLLADALTADSPVPRELAVDRFDGGDQDELRDRALRLYRDIYANDARTIL